ncbi:MAG: YjjG family noncanonical pyrimidine nucleotidase [Limisphaerales bacterium]
MQHYKWLLFDADGTLFDYDRAENAALNQVFQLIGVAFDPSHLVAYRQINSALWQAVEKGEVTPGFVKVRRFELLLESIGVAYPPSMFSARYLECLAECSELVEGAAEVLQALQGNYRMAILTNGLQVVQRGRLAGSVIRQQIAEIIISEEIGFAKPAKEFFDAALARLGHPSRRELLMIGDGWASDIVGAIEYGIDACWYNPGHKPRPAVCGLTREIASLRELVAWLG